MNRRNIRSAIAPLTIQEALDRISEIEIITRKLSEDIQNGNHISEFTGTGTEFSEIRDYNFGDDIRAIDWNTTARFNKPFLRICTEEHDATVYLLIDRSASGTFGREISKDEKMLEIAASIIFSAERSGDSTGLCLFTDRVESFIPARKGKKHTTILLNELISHVPESGKTEIREALSYISSAIKKRALIIIISDFDSPDFEDELLILNQRHEVRAVVLRDTSESRIPDMGYMLIIDPETEEEIIINTSDRTFQDNYREIFSARKEGLMETFYKAGIHPLEIFTDQDTSVSLKRYFRLREKGRVKQA